MFKPKNVHKLLKTTFFLLPTVLWILELSDFLILLTTQKISIKIPETILKFIELCVLKLFIGFNLLRCLTIVINITSLLFKCYMPNFNDLWHFNLYIYLEVLQPAKITKKKNLFHNFYFKIILKVTFMN